MCDHPWISRFHCRLCLCQGCCSVQSSFERNRLEQRIPGAKLWQSLPLSLEDILDQIESAGWDERCTLEYLSDLVFQHRLQTLQSAIDEVLSRPHNTADDDYNKLGNHSNIDHTITSSLSTKPTNIIDEKIKKNTEPNEPIDRVSSIPNVSINVSLMMPTTDLKKLRLWDSFGEAGSSSPESYRPMSVGHGSMDGGVSGSMISPLLLGQSAGMRGSDEHTHLSNLSDIEEYRLSPETDEILMMTSSMSEYGNPNGNDNDDHPTNERSRQYTSQRTTERVSQSPSSSSSSSKEIRSLLSQFPSELVSLICEFEMQGSMEDIDQCVKVKLSESVNRRSVIPSISAWLLTLFGLLIFYSTLSFCAHNSPALSQRRWLSLLNWWWQALIALLLVSFHCFGCIKSFLNAQRRSPALKTLKRAVYFGILKQRKSYLMQKTDDISITTHTLSNMIEMKKSDDDDNDERIKVMNEHQLPKEIQLIEQVRKKEFRSGEVFIPVLVWLNFPYIECVDLDWRWFCLLGYKYCVGLTIALLFCVPSHFTRNQEWCFYTPIVAGVCWFGAWLHQSTVSNHDFWRSLMDLIIVSLLVLFVFGLIAVIGYVTERSLSHSNGGDNNDSDNDDKHSSSSLLLDHKQTDLYFLIAAVVLGLCYLFIQYRVIKGLSINLRSTMPIPEYVSGQHSSIDSGMIRAGYNNGSGLSSSSMMFGGRSDSAINQESDDNDENDDEKEDDDEHQHRYMIGHPQMMHDYRVIIDHWLSLSNQSPSFPRHGSLDSSSINHAPYHSHHFHHRNHPSRNELKTAIVVRSHLFAMEFLVSLILVLFFWCIELVSGVLAGLVLCLWHICILWNEQLHKKLLSTQFNFSRRIYVYCYRSDPSHLWILHNYFGVVFLGNSSQFVY